MPDTLPASELPSTSRCGGSGDGNGPLPKRLKPVCGGAPRSTPRCSITSAVRVRLPAGLLQCRTGRGWVIGHVAFWRYQGTLVRHALARVRASKLDTTQASNASTTMRHAGLIAFWIRLDAVKGGAAHLGAAVGMAPEERALCSSDCVGSRSLYMSSTRAGSMTVPGSPRRRCPPSADGTTLEPLLLF